MLFNGGGNRADKNGGKPVVAVVQAGKSFLTCALQFAAGNEIVQLAIHQLNGEIGASVTREDRDDGIVILMIEGKARSEDSGHNSNFKGEKIRIVAVKQKMCDRGLTVG